MTAFKNKNHSELMKKILSFSAAFLCTIFVQAQTVDALYYKVDLNNITDDKLTIELTVPQMKEDKVSFHLPKMVPGTYSIYNFGRFVTDMKVYDKEGNGLDFKRTDENSWEILEGKKLARIIYKVEDSWDTKLDNVVFEPAGTNIDADKVFVFNNHGIFGFFKGMEYSPIKIEVDRPANFFGGTAMKRIGGDADTDIFEASSYHLLVDSPIMFAEPDTAIIKVGNAEVLIQVYSPSKKIKASELVADIFPILDAQREYLGGNLPVDKYAFIIFLNKAGQNYLSRSAGALEHSYSSFYCLFEGEPKNIAQTLRDVAAHEFFHIVTPLSIHSEEIHYFDFIDPKMSQHLWLYEGVTEYSAQHVQVKQGLVSIEHFLNQMSQKMATGDYFNNEISFTEMSKTCLDVNKKQYGNVYMKGALIGMCVDLKLLILSGGKYGIQNLMVDLSKKYGIQKPFKDDEFFGEMAAVSGFPEIKDFMMKHVGGTAALPIAELTKEAGINYSEKGFSEELSLFGFNPQTGFTFDAKTSRLKLLSEDALDDFGKELGLKKNDLFKVWNGEELTLLNVQDVLQNYAMGAAVGNDLKITVLREKALPAKEMKKRDKMIKKGKTVEALPLEEVNLQGKLKIVKTAQKHAFNIDDKASEKQLNIRKSWLGNYKRAVEMPAKD